MQTLILGRRPYAEVEVAMRDFTTGRGPADADQLWLVEHDPVFTQGVAGRDSHVHALGDIPLVRTDRGGQVTYHGPGQVVAYPLLDLRRRGLYVKTYVHRLEEAAIRTLADWDVTGHRVRGAPGIYVRVDDPSSHAVLVPDADPFRGLGKIAALGIRIRRHCAYHGLSLNVAMDLEPYTRIDPCGYAGLQTVDLRSLGVAADWQSVAQTVSTHLQRLLQA